jgi:hypothetical protein
MHTVFSLLREGKKIEAIKEFRAAFGSGLKEAKQAIEALMEIMVPLSAQQTEYVVISRHTEDSDYEVMRTYGKGTALYDANSIVDVREEVIVAAVIAQSVVIIPCVRHERLRRVPAPRRRAHERSHPNGGVRLVLGRIADGDLLSAASCRRPRRSAPRSADLRDTRSSREPHLGDRCEAFRLRDMRIAPCRH